MDDGTIHVVVTGGSRGIGFGLTKNFLKHQCNVTISGLDKSRLNSALKILKKDFPGRVISGFVSNAANKNEVEQLFNNAVQINGNIDIWVNNAGRGQEMEYAWDLEPDEYENIIATNITGMIHGSLTAIKHMKKQGYGRIYNMEGFGSNGMIQRKITVYGTTKRAVRYFSRSLARGAEGTGVMVGTISPGMVITDFITRPLQNQSREEQGKTKKIFNILGDKVETVAPFLVKQMLKNNKNAARIEWLTKPKLIWRFLKSPFGKRDLFSTEGTKDV